MTPDDEPAAGVAYDPTLFAWVLRDVRPVQAFQVKGRLGQFQLLRLEAGMLAREILLFVLPPVLAVAGTLMGVWMTHRAEEHRRRDEATTREHEWLRTTVRETYGACFEHLIRLEFAARSDHESQSASGPAAEVLHHYTEVQKNLLLLQTFQTDDAARSTLDSQILILEQYRTNSGALPNVAVQVYQLVKALYQKSVRPPAPAPVSSATPRWPRLASAKERIRSLLAAARGSKASGKQ
jgi:hypothetical protein